MKNILHLFCYLFLCSKAYSMQQAPLALVLPFALALPLRIDKDRELFAEVVLAASRQDLDTFVKIVHKHTRILHYADNDGNTLLHWIVKNGSAVMVQLLLDYGMRKDATNKFGITPFNLAYKDGKLTMMLLLR